MESLDAVLICLIVAAGIHFTTACNGYKARLVKLENCGDDDQVIKIDPDFIFTLNSDCDVIMAGCMETVGYSSGLMKYTILKNGSRISSGTVDMCADQKKDSKGIKSTVVSFGFPDECPVPKMRTCADGSQKISVRQRKSFLAFAAGNIDITIEGSHDTGKTCLHAVLNISR